MFALYYVHPTGGFRYACVSGRHMHFADAAPALFARAENVETRLRAYRRSAINSHAARGHRQYLARHHITGELPGADDPTLACFRIVPMTVTPNFDDEYIPG